MPDYRSDPMPSAEGEGNARSRWQQAWDAYTRTVAKVPGVEPTARWEAGRITEDLLGFWLMWHLEGGFEGLRRLGMSRSAVYRRISVFRRVFGAHPDAYELPGVSIDVAAYLRASGARQGDTEDVPES
jgi:hypothetical protein